MLKRLRGCVLASALVVAACGGEADREDTGMEGMPEMQGTQDSMAMPGMPGMATQSAQMDELMTQMQRMQGLSPDNLRGMLPAYRQTAANALAEMNRQMREMNMTTDAEWNATVDSLRQDLTRMPEMSATELQTLMPSHHERMQRLVGRHRAMMAPAPM